MNSKMKFVVSAVLAFAMLAGVAVPFVGQKSVEAAPASLAQTQYVSLLNGSAYAASQTGAKFSSLKYATADCYSVVDVTASQTVTVKFQHSGDGSNWVDLASLSAVSADGASFTHTLVYGTYLRAVATLGTTNTVGVNAHCVLKD